MPLFESQKSRDKRLFATVASRVSSILSSLVTDEDDRKVYALTTSYLAVLAGGTVAAKQVVEHCICVKKAWGKGDEEKALALIKLFTLVMLSRWYVWLDEKQQPSEDERRQARVMAGSNILRLFGDDSENAIEDFLNMDIQYNYEWDSTARVPMLKMNSLILAKACEACGHPAINWSRIAFPVKEWQDVVDSGAIIDHSPFVNLRDIVAVGSCRVAGVETMFNTLKANIRMNELEDKGRG
jgi:hypothetical protein